MIKRYYHLAKPGIIYGNLMTAVAGFLLASQSHISGSLLVSMMLGLGLVIASGCVLNNIYDLKIDLLMERTKYRVLAQGLITKKSAFVYGFFLGLIGFTILFFYTSFIAFIVALAGFICYAVIYTPLKHKTSWAAVIGAFAGAVPPVVGYTAVINRLDATALLLFAVLFIWQLPHFYSIAIRRLGDYAKANVPVLPVTLGIRMTKIHIVILIVLFIAVVMYLPYLKITGLVYMLVLGPLLLYWLYLSVRGFQINEFNQAIWAKKMYRVSLAVLTVFSLLISINSIINI